MQLRDLWQRTVDHYSLFETSTSQIEMYEYFNQDLHWSSKFEVLHDHQRTDQMIKCYIQNCYVYRKSKASRDRINKLLKSLLIFKQRWQNISLDFIINLSESDENNVILTVIDRLSKKQHYISCWSDDEEIFAEQTVKLLLIWVFRTHELSRSIVFDRDL